MPLNEETESYRIQVKAKGQLKRELMVGTSVWDYTVAMRADDGVVGAYAVEVAQMSAQFGAGLAARTVVATSCGPFWSLSYDGGARSVGRAIPAAHAIGCENVASRGFWGPLPASV